MCVAVKDGADAVAIDRLFETARSEIRKNLRRLSFDGGADWGVVQQRDALPRAQPRERGLELERFVNGFLHECLDRPFAPRAERAAAEAAREALDAGKPDTLYFRRFPIEHGDAAVDENLPDLVGLAAFVVVVAEDRDDRDLHRSRELADEHACLIGQSVVREIAAQQQHIRRRADLTEERMCRWVLLVRSGMAQR